MTVRVGVPAETARRERRVALVPDGVRVLVRAGVEVQVEAGAGSRAYFSDEAYRAAGATVADAAGGAWQADVVVKVQRPSVEEAARLRAGATLVALLAGAPGQSAADDPVLVALDRAGVIGLALERVPRITRAQSMDVLSSQATVAGYKAVLVAASEAAKLLPMLTTAAGSLAPAKAFIVGAGVAGLQAIATARRLGAVVSAFDVRSAAREQVQSLGATFVAAEAIAPDAEAKGGYARAQTEEEQRRTAELIAGHIKEMDIVITTAQVPGRAAPRIVTAAMVRSMRPGSVVVDLAAETGGNCELTRAGETIEEGGVKVIGPINLASTIPFHASQMFSKNIVTVLQHLLKDGALAVDAADEIVGAMLVTAVPAATGA
jgi:H+-translocating NAD(P) transhydrogenase subunit alpha